ncbi:SIMPL domain-containing protein [Brevundimonas balnearis]|uniref:SIMPL domain-containing protein n=1 Tax=Brevundimonas balnearis TaxID=1572858 RepID=A0ABV6R5Q7_9CAUL
MTRSALVAALGASMLAAVAAAPAVAQVQPIQIVQPTPSLNLSAFGEVKAAPDMATLTFGVVTEAQTAAEAMRLNAERMTEVVAALRRAGVAERDIQTTGLNLSPQYDYIQNESPRLRGYQASNRVTVNVRELDRTGQVADAVVAAGVNQIDGISFGLQDPSAAENQARRLAVQALRAKAELYAQALGVPLGPIKSLTEAGGYAPPPPMPMYRMAARAEAMDVSTPVAGGELTVRIDVNGVYEIGR